MTARLLTIDAAAYHSDQVGDTPTLSSSIAKLLLTHSPAHAYTAHPKLNPDWQREDDSRFDLGNVCHALLLQGLETAEICDFPDWRTKAAKEARDLARAHGRIPMLTDQWTEVEAMVAAVRAHLADLDVAPTPFTSGTPEQTITWQENGVWCRARLDWLHHDHAVCDDFKSTSRSANPEAWCRNTFWSIGADLQAVLYERGIKAATGQDAEFRFIVAETNAPYCVSVVGIPPEVREFANKKLDHAIDLWRRCLETGEWPGYPNRIVYPLVPAYLESQWYEQEAREELAA